MLRVFVRLWGKEWNDLSGSAGYQGLKPWFSKVLQHMHKFKHLRSHVLTVGLLRCFKLKNCLNVLLNMTGLNKRGTGLKLSNVTSGRANTINEHQVPVKRVPCFSRVREILKWCCCVGVKSDQTVIHCTLTFPCCRDCLSSLVAVLYYFSLLETNPNRKWLTV